LDPLRRGARFTPGLRRNQDDDQTMTADTAAAIRAPAKARRPFFRRRSAIPGFSLTLGVTLTILSLIVLIPLSAVA
jgi:sulfate transport system permease protein